VIEPMQRLDEGALRVLVPRVLAGLVRRGEDFDAAEDALQEALLEALRVWPEHPPRDPRAWLTTVATRRLVDARRSDVARHRREEATHAEPRPVATEDVDDTLLLPPAEERDQATTFEASAENDLQAKSPPSDRVFNTVMMRFLLSVGTVGKIHANP